MNKEKFTEYANSFQAIARLRLESIENLLSHLGNPQKELQFVHIAGTNGKGSVSAFLQCMLSASGKKTGKYTSPNLISVSERICIDGVQISPSELSDLLARVEEASQLTYRDLGGFPTQFEIWTAAAFLYFLQKKCDIVVLETGLGGTRDATNIIPPPLVSVITHIAMDHTQYLGNTLSEIAAEKAGIIKSPSSGVGCTVSARQSPVAAAVLEKVCRERQNRLIFAKSPVPVSHSTHGEIFNYDTLEKLHCSLPGLHQLDNAAAAIETAKYLSLSEDCIRKGLAEATNPARFEIFRENPLTVFDGAHNPDGMRAFAEELNRYFPNHKKNLIMASMGDKDISASLSELKNVLQLQKIYTVTVKDNPRAISAEDLAELIKSAGFAVQPCESISDALSKCNTDLTAICGSLYLYKDFREARFQK